MAKNDSKSLAARLSAVEKLLLTGAPPGIETVEQLLEHVRGKIEPTSEDQA